MKNILKRTLAVLLCLVLLGGAAPMAGIAQWAGGLTASAASKKITDYSVGDLVQFGSYPQSEVTDSATVATLNARASGWKSYGYYSGSGTDWGDGSGQPSDYMRYCDVELNGSYYRGVTFDTYRSYYTNYKSTTSTSYTYQGDNGYIYGNTYWFLYELLTWRVLDPATGLVLCENIIDSQAYNNYILRANGDSWGDASKTRYANNYAESSLRRWLNEDFYNTAFNDSEKLLITAKTRENKARGSRYDSASTTDKITLLTYQDMVNTSYGFSSSQSASDMNRRASGTDYAKSQGLYVNSSDTDKKGNKCSVWLLRSASFYSSCACDVYYDGDSGNYNYEYSWDGSYVGDTYVGVRPAFNFNLTSEISSSVHGPGNGSGKLLVTRSFAQDEYGILVIDKFGNPIQDAAVTWNSTGNHAEEKTDKNGLAVFKALTLGQPTITAKKSGYITFSNAGTNYTKNAYRYDIVTLYKDSDQESAYKLKSAKYINSTTPSGMDILTRTKSISLSDASVLGVRGDGKFDLSCVPNSMDGVKSIEVWQGNKKIASSTTTTIQGVEIQKFSEGGGVEIRVYTPDMGYVKTPVNLKFYKDKAVDPDDFSLEFNSSLNLSIGSDVPYVGGGELSVNNFPIELLIKLPVEFYTENDDGDWKFHLGVNTKIKSGEKNDEGKWTEKEKETYKQQRKKYIKDVKDNLAAINKYADGAKTAITKGRYTKLKNLAKKQTSTDFFNKVDVTFLGYAEGAWNGEGMKSVTVNIVVAVKVQLADCTWQYFAWVVPITVRIKADFSTEAGFNGTYNFQTHTWSLDGTLTFGVSLNAFGGVGIGKAVGVGAYGDADLSAVFELLGTSSAHGFKTVDLTGELGLEAYFLMFDYKKSFAHKTWNLYTKTAKQMVSAQAEAASSPYDMSAFTLQDTTYMQGESAWLGDGGFVSAQSADNTIHNLLTGTYRNNQPVIATAGNTTVMVYTTADASRNAYNATRVMYSVYNKDTGTWSTPEGVDNNGTADSTPYLYSDGTKIYIAYSDSARLFTATDDILAVSANQNMVTAVFNAATGKFENFVTVAEGNGKFLSTPKIGTVNGKITTVWQSNNANDPLGLTSETSVYANDPTGTKLIAKPSGTVVGLAVGAQGIAVVEDPDKDLDTVNDRVLRIGTAKLDEGTISNPVYENGTLYWYANGGISTYDGEVCALYPQAVPGLTDKFVVCADRILFLSAKEGVSDIYALTQTDGQWNAPVQMTHQGMVIDTLSATMIDGEILTIMSRKDIDITETQVVSNCNLSYLFLGNTYDIQTDYAEYDQDAVKPGTDLPVQIGITNGGDTTVSGVYVTIEKKDGTAVFEDSVHTNLKPGESGEITVSMPTDGLSEATDYTVLVEQLYVADADEDNNKTEMTVGYTELSVSAEQLSFENGDQILVHVVNNSDIPSSGKVTVQCGENVLETFDVPSLEKNEQYTYSVDVSKERIGSEQAIVDLTVDPEKEQLRTYSAHSQVALDFRGAVSETEYSASWYVGSDVYVQHYKTGDSIVPPTVTAPVDYAIDGWQEAIPATMGTENLVFHALLTEKTHTHSGTLQNVVQASCKATGYSGDLICSLCQEVMQAGHTTEKLEHRYDAIIVEATCALEGYTEYVCSTCGDKYRANFTLTDASKHTYGAWTIIQEPTATAEGLRQAVCSTCGNKKQESIPKLKIELKSVTLSDVSVQYKSTVTLSPKVEADQGTNYTVAFTSSNPKIAEVDKDGKITTHKKGTVTITCTVTNNDDPTNVVETTATVTVKYAWWQWLIRILLLGFLWY